MAEHLDLTDFPCPRCGSRVAERLYGPCGRCRGALRAGQQVEAKEVVTGRFEPAMHVTPNAVALRDD